MVCTEFIFVSHLILLFLEPYSETPRLASLGESLGERVNFYVNPQHNLDPRAASRGFKAHSKILQKWHLQRHYQSAIRSRGTVFAKFETNYPPGRVRTARKLRVEQFQVRTTRHGWRGWKPSHGRHSLVSLSAATGWSARCNLQRTRRQHPCEGCQPRHPWRVVHRFRRDVKSPLIRFAHRSSPTRP